MENIEKEIYEKIIEKMDVDESGIEEFTYDTPIFYSSEFPDRLSMGLDSIDALELLVIIYDEWGIDVPGEDMGKLKTVNAIAEYIREHEEN